MSSQYQSEPPTAGKVVLHTSMGDIEIELWTKQAPLACRNFVQLAMEGFYNDSTFHRVVKGFLVQGGDPTGTGEGGESIYGGPFKDEIHSRLRFNRRGLLAMANTAPNRNTSQFFFTLERVDLPTPTTIFGTVVGETIYNLLSMGDVDVDKDEKPLYPVILVSVEVVSEPFGDVVPRVKVVEAAPVNEESSRVKKVKNRNLLSFGDDEAPAESIKKKVKTIYDIHPESSTPTTSKPSASTTPVNAPKILAPKILDAPKTHVEEKTYGVKKEKGDQKEIEILPETSTESSESQIAMLKTQIKSLKSQPKPVERILPAPKKSYLEEYKAANKVVTGKRTRSSEDETLRLLSAFKSKIRGKSTIITNKGSPSATEGARCDIHSLQRCETCFPDIATLEEEEEIRSGNWFRKPLIFGKETGVKDIYSVDDYMVLDPRSIDLGGKQHISAGTSRDTNHGPSGTGGWRGGSRGRGLSRGISQYDSSQASQVKEQNRRR